MNKKSGKVTIYDIAEAAGVSVSTVSRVLGNEEYPVSSSMRQKVNDAANSLGYVKRNANKQENARYAAVVIPNLNNPYYSALVTGLERYLRLSNINMLLINACGSFEIEKQLLSQLRNVMGVIISPSTQHTEHIDQLLKSGMNIVIMEQPTKLSCNSVCFNYYKGGKMATDYLIQQGFRRIAFVTPPITRYSRNEIYNGYLSALSHANIPFSKDLIFASEKEEHTFDGSYEYTTGVSLTMEILHKKELPEAIFCINDMIAFGVLQVLQKQHIRVPEDVSIIGFDNIIFTSIVTPELTTIDQCTYEIGSIAAQLLHESFIDPTRKLVSITLEPKLVERSTVKKIDEPRPIL